jgi:hypothetical protein
MLTSPAFALDNAPIVILDGRTLSFDVPPEIAGGQQLLPARAVFEAMGATVGWDEHTRTATATKGSTTVVLPLDSQFAEINDVPYTLAAAPEIVAGRILAPLSFVVDAFGAQAVWDDSTQTVTIADGPDSQIPIRSTSPGGFDLLQRKFSQGNTDLLYPTVTDLADAAVQDQINDDIVRQVYGYHQLAWVGQSDPMTRYWVSYKIGLNQNGLLSLVLSESALPFHAANPNSAQLSLTVDTTAKIYQLKDLFVGQSDYVKRISDIISQQIRDRDIVLIKPFAEISPDQEYYLTPEGLVVYFQSDEYTPHYYGSPEFVIPFNDVRDLLPQQSPVWNLHVNAINTPV